ncbi:VOC family protein [Nocardioides ochotonae]|uniref:VOC family protein n=1 Tax=Nocardioides ochotonae TaxID=2685869 RepID=UPI00174C5451|nr:VOC family protein [Nocardioides ochotonae]
MTEIREIRALGYVTVSSTDMERWREFAFDVLSFGEGSGPDPDALYLRMDERAARIVVRPGDTDGVRTVGWEVRDHLALARVEKTLADAGYAPKRLSAEEADERRVEEVLAFTDPSGLQVEIFFGPVLDHSPLVTRHGSRFVTSGVGLGHVVLPTTDIEASQKLYLDTLGFLPRGAMKLETPPGVPTQRIRFIGVNQRHHSLALCPAPAMKDPALIHIMVEVDSLDDVGRALDRSNKAGYSLSSTLGRHTNDKMISFYVRAPGGWDVEYGCEGMLVDESHYTAEEITADSYWGHDWSGSEPLAAFS